MSDSILHGNAVMCSCRENVRTSFVNFVWEEFLSSKSAHILVELRSPPTIKLFIFNNLNHQSIHPPSRSSGFWVVQTQGYRDLCTSYRFNNALRLIQKNKQVYFPAHLNPTLFSSLVNLFALGLIEPLAV